MFVTSNVQLYIMFLHISCCLETFHKPFKSIFIRCYLRSHELWSSFMFIVNCNNVCVECDVFVRV